MWVKIVGWLRLWDVGCEMWGGGEDCGMWDGR